MHPDSRCPLVLEDWFPGKLQFTKAEVHNHTAQEVQHGTELVIVTERQ